MVAAGAGTGAKAGAALNRDGGRTTKAASVRAVPVNRTTLPDDAPATGTPSGIGSAAESQDGEPGPGS